MLAAAGVATMLTALPAAHASQGVPFAGAVPAAGDWPFAGQNTHNTHSGTGVRISPNNVGRLAPKWTLTTGGSVSATPTVVRGTVYVPDWGGNLWAVNAATGQPRWQRKVSTYSDVAGDVSRLSPAYADGMLVTGSGAQTTSSTAGALAFAVDARTGNRVWKTLLDADPAAIVTGSPVVDRGVAYFGVSSKAEAVDTPPTFRGSVVALDAHTGKLLWKTWMVPDGYTGGAVWGSTPVVDRRTGLVFVGVGNNYTTPPGVCTTPVETKCVTSPDTNMIDAIVALDVKTGRVAWSHRTLTADTWTLFERLGPDFDFGTGPNLYTTTIHGKRTDLLGIGQKNGLYYALNPATGATVWQTEAGPGSGYGGILWGTATDGNRVYAAISTGNQDEVPITSADGHKSTTTGGFWTAMDAATGKVVWQTADPQSDFMDTGFVTMAGGVVYAGSLANTGDNMYALDAHTGKISWRFRSGGAVMGGAAVVGDTVYWGSGYHTLDMGLDYDGENNKLYAFSAR